MHSGTIFIVYVNHDVNRSSISNKLMNTYLDVVCYRSKILSDGTSPIMLRLTKDGKRKYVGLHLSIDPVYWDFKKNLPKRNCPDKDAILSIVEKKLSEYRNAITQLKVEGNDYTLDTLAQRVDKPVIRQTFGTYINGYIEILLADNRNGYAKSFIELSSSVAGYKKTLDFYFSEIDIQWLRGYEIFLRNRGNRQNTIGIRFRALRALYNRAVSDKVVKKDLYPFDEFKVSEFHEQTKKRSITRDDIKRIIDLDLKTITTYHSPYLEFGRDLFLFSYLSCGINLTDMAKLQYADIENGRLIYKRQKTHRLLTVRLQPLALNIIEKYRSNESEYLFPILDKTHKTETQKRDRIHKVMKATNRALKRIGDKLGLPIEITTYVARHTYATVLKRSGVGTAIISESLGHSSERVTQIYLDSFENTQIDEAMKNLL